MKNFTRFALILMIGLAFLAMAAMAQVMPAQRRTLTETKMQQIAAQRLERLQEMHPERFEAMDGQSRERLYQQELHRLQRTHAQHEEKRTQRLDSLRQANESRRRLKGVTDDIPISETDSLALVALYNATNGDYWYYNDNWLTGPVNTWYGIEQWEECIEWDDIGCVAWVDRLGLKLSGNNLTGTLPEEMGDLISFHSLFFGQNELTGEIPWTIGNLSNLRELDLYYINLTGEIPWTIGNLSNLNFLDLSYNNLSGIIPPTIGDCYNLQFFIVAYNELTYIPMEICDAFNSDWGDFYFSGNYFDLASCPAIECLAFKCVWMWEGWQNNGYDLLYDCLEPPVFLFDDVTCADGTYYDFPEIFWYGYPCIDWNEWQSSGTGYFDDPYEMHPVYFPSVDDYQQGCIEIYVEVSSNFGCWLETMELCFDPAPQADAGGDTTIYANETWPLIAAGADHYQALNWESDGDGTFAPSNNVVNPVYTPGPGDIAAGQAVLCLTAYGDLSCDYSEATDCMTLFIVPLPTQIINLQPGWTGISSYLMPDEPAIDELMAAIQEQLIILMDHDGNHYQSSNKNLFNWEHTKGYYIKMASQAALEVEGVYPLSGQLDLQQGWNLIPVLSDEPVEIEELFWSNLQKLEIITEVAGLNVYWPDKEISTLQTLEPGKAYLVKATEQISFTIPTVITTPVAEITDNSAISGGEVTDEGSSPVTVRGVVWSALPNPTTTQHDGITADGEGEGGYVSELTGLTSGTTYYLRSYATNHVGTAYGEELSFTTLWECSYPFIDSRDGQSYQTVQIGDQCWMAENLNIGTRINGSSNQTNNGTIEKYCYNNFEAQCDIYGGLYQWNEMMGYSTTPGVQGICPEGWHLPTDAEWCALEQEVDPTISCSSTGWHGVDGGGKLKETGTTHWNSPNTGATNSSGFTALPGGYRATNGSFSHASYGGYWWSSSESDGSYAWGRSLYYDRAQVSRYYYGKSRGFSVRCLKDN
jgi:uncharacterized protein (TIGR02145 family)